MRVYSSGQRGLAVNQLPTGFEGSNPSARTIFKIFPLGNKTLIK